MLRKLIGSAAAATMIVALAPGAAHAAQKSVSDPGDDASSAATNITGMVATNTNTVVKGKIKIKDVKATGKISLAVVKPGTTTGWQVDITKTSSGIKKVYYFSKADGTLVKKLCSGIKTSWSASNDVVNITVPQKCYTPGAPGKWQFIAVTYKSGVFDDFTDNMPIVAKG